MRHSHGFGMGKTPKLFARFALACAALCGAVAAQGQFTYSGCADVAENQFRYQQMIGRSSTTAPKLVDATLTEPLKLAFDMLTDGTQDIYIVQRGGALKKYNTGTNSIVTVGTIPVSTGGEWGFTGVALDPNFKANHWIYVFYAATGPNTFHISRLTLNAAHTQFLNNNMTSEKKLITMGAVSGVPHTGSGMAFDSYGDLWIPVGKNAADYSNSYSETDSTRSTESTSSNGASLRGGVLRIHPDDAAPRGYTIPAGNYGEYFANYFRSKGTRADSTVAAEYADTAKVKPELYVKGTRNAYSISVDPVKRVLAWGEFGVNTTNTYTEEHNLVTHPIFGGYPYFAGGGNGHPLFNLWSNTGSGYNGATGFQAAHGSLVEDPAAPVNNSVWNKGPKQLPPATPALHTYLHTLNTAPTNGAGAITGPIYQYDAASASTIKFPPHFQGAWFMTDYIQEASNLQGIRVYKLDAAGAALTDSLVWFKTYGFNYPIAFQQGLDGALYVVNYSATRFGSDGNTSIARIEYTGNCRPAVSAVNRRMGAHALRAAMGVRGFKVDETAFTLTVRDVAGRELSRFSEKRPRTFALSELGPEAHGVLVATLASARGTEDFRLFKD